VIVWRRLLVGATMLRLNTVAQGCACSDFERKYRVPQCELQKQAEGAATVVRVLLLVEVLPFPLPPPGVRREAGLAMAIVFSQFSFNFLQFAQVCSTSSVISIISHLPHHFDPILFPSGVRWGGLLFR